MAIELGVSFMVGVSCLVFSLNLVRKLSEEDQFQHRGGGDGGFGDSVDRMSTATRGVGVGGGGGGLDGAMVTVRKSDENLGRSRSPAAACDRGIGSLLTRHSGSRLDTYDDSDDEYVETTATMPATTEDQCGTGVCVFVCVCACCMWCVLVGLLDTTKQYVL